MQAPPYLTIFFVWFDLACFEAGLQKHEWRCEVVPERIAEEVQHLQLVPRRRQSVTGEGTEGIFKLPADLAGGIFNPNSLRREVADLPCLRIGRNRHPLFVRGDPHRDIREACWVSFDLK